MYAGQELVLTIRKSSSEPDTIVASIVLDGFHIDLEKATTLPELLEAVEKRCISKGVTIARDWSSRWMPGERRGA